MNVKNLYCSITGAILGLIVLSLIADGSLLSMAFLAGASPAYAQERGDGTFPGQGGRVPGKSPQFNRGGPGGPPMQPGGGGGQRGPGFQPGFGPGGGYGPGVPPNTGPGGPGFAPCPPNMRPPQGPGPWHTDPWMGVGPEPWWFGRPFLWSLTATATVTAIAGITYYLLDGLYYRPYMQDGNTVYVQIPPPY